MPPFGEGYRPGGEAGPPGGGGAFSGGETKAATPTIPASPNTAGTDLGAERIVRSPDSDAESRWRDGPGWNGGGTPKEGKGKKGKEGKGGVKGMLADVAKAVGRKLVEDRKGLVETFHEERDKLREEQRQREEAEAEARAARPLKEKVKEAVGNALEPRKGLVETWREEKEKAKEAVANGHRLPNRGVEDADEAAETYVWKTPVKDQDLKHRDRRPDGEGGGAETGAAENRDGATADSSDGAAADTRAGNGEQTGSRDATRNADGSDSELVEYLREDQRNRRAEQEAAAREADAARNGSNQADSQQQNGDTRAGQGQDNGTASSSMMPSRSSFPGNTPAEQEAARDAWVQQQIADAAARGEAISFSLPAGEAPPAGRDTRQEADDARDSGGDTQRREDDRRADNGSGRADGHTGGGSGGEAGRKRGREDDSRSETDQRRDRGRRELDPEADAEYIRGEQARSVAGRIIADNRLNDNADPVEVSDYADGIAPEIDAVRDHFAGRMNGDAERGIPGVPEEEVLHTVRSLVGNTEGLGLLDGQLNPTDEITRANMAEALFLAASADPEGFAARVQAMQEQGQLQGIDSIVLNNILGTAMGEGQYSLEERRMMAEGDDEGAAYSYNERMGSREDNSPEAVEERRRQAEQAEQREQQIDDETRETTEKILKETGKDPNADKAGHEGKVDAEGVKVKNATDDIEQRLLAPIAEADMNTEGGLTDEQRAAMTEQALAEARAIIGSNFIDLGHGLEEITPRNMAQAIIQAAIDDRAGFEQRAGELTGPSSDVATTALGVAGGETMTSVNEDIADAIKDRGLIKDIKSGVVPGKVEQVEVPVLGGTRIVEVPVADTDVQGKDAAPPGWESPHQKEAYTKVFGEDRTKETPLSDPVDVSGTDGTTIGGAEGGSPAGNGDAPITDNGSGSATVAGGTVEGGVGPTGTQTTGGPSAIDGGAPFAPGTEDITGLPTADGTGPIGGAPTATEPSGTDIDPYRPGQQVTAGGADSGSGPSGSDVPYAPGTEDIGGLPTADGTGPIDGTPDGSEPSGGEGGAEPIRHPEPVQPVSVDGPDSGTGIGTVPYAPGTESITDVPTAEGTGPISGAPTVGEPIGEPISEPGSQPAGGEPSGGEPTGVAGNPVTMNEPNGTGGEVITPAPGPVEAPPAPLPEPASTEQIYGTDGTTTVVANPADGTGTITTGGETFTFAPTAETTAPTQQDDHGPSSVEGGADGQGGYVAGGSEGNSSVVIDGGDVFVGGEIGAAPTGEQTVAPSVVEGAVAGPAVVGGDVFVSNASRAAAEDGMQGDHDHMATTYAPDAGGFTDAVQSTGTGVASAAFSERGAGEGDQVTGAEGVEGEAADAEAPDVEAGPAAS